MFCFPLFKPTQMCFGWSPEISHPPGIARWQPPRRCQCWASRGSWLRPVQFDGHRWTPHSPVFGAFLVFGKKEIVAFWKKRNLTECVSGYKRALVNGEDHPFFFPALDSCMTPWSNKSRNLNVHRIAVTKDGERGLLLHRSRFRSSTCDRLWEVHPVTTVWPPCDHGAGRRTGEFSAGFEELDWHFTVFTVSYFT